MTLLSERIAHEIASRGPISCARFMELALYSPGMGYYERAEVGREGDFYTSVSVGPLFGELLAWQIHQWCLNLSAPVILECGAHHGAMAHDILSRWPTWHGPQPRPEYWIIEPSARLKGEQEQRLAGFAPGVRWFGDWSELPGRFRGVVLSNELLDAMPVHRLGWDASRRRWFEWRVASHREGFSWVRGEAWPDGPAVAPELAEHLPDAFSCEISPAAEAWWKQAAQHLEQGKLVAIDYGLTDQEVFDPRRLHGTLRTYQKHHSNASILEAPGAQDITAHVNFSRIQRVGEAEGLHTDELIAQTQFLVRIAATLWNDPRARPWDTGDRRQFQTLTHPEHLGRSFRVLIQSR